jgi:pimeloyl-ACP methyl ester carboxylesterase
MTEITHRTVPTNGINLHIAESGSGPLVLLIHGFPELWYSWRHQLVALADAGYHAVAPDVRGYGESDKPGAIEDYAMKALIADYLGLLDALGEETAVIVGHDWGSAQAWNSAALHPERYRAVVGMSVPHFGRFPIKPTEALKAAFGDRWFYILYFQEPGKAEAEFERDPHRTMRMMLGGERNFDAAAAASRTKDATFFQDVPDVESLPPWLGEDDVRYFGDAFAKSGFRGPLNRYRAMDLDWEQLPELGDRKIEQPALFITGERDPVKTFSAPAEGMRALVPGLGTIIEVPGAGHWVQQENPAEVNAALLTFLAGL